MRRPSPIRWLLSAALLVLGLAPDAGAQVRLQKVDDFSAPVYVTGAPGDYSRLYVVEQQGRIRVVRRGAKLSTPFVDLTSQVLSGGERGLLSLAFSPDFPTSRLLYVYYTDMDGDIRVDELRAANPDQADPGYRRPVIEIAHREAANHNGGQLHFGPDGYLYFATGDGGRSYDEPNRDAVNRGSLLGKVLRIDPRGASPYAIPAGNPFAGRAGERAEIWGYGLRNPFRFSFDRATGDLVIADVGEATVEEVDFSPAASGGGRGAYYGWDECEGNFRSEPKPTSTSTACPLQNDVRPVLSLLQSDGYCSVIGGYVVRYPSLPSLRGRYVYGDFCRGNLRTALLRGSSVTDDRDVGAGAAVSALSSFGEDTAGCVYATSLSGPVYRLLERSRPVPCPDGTPPRVRVRVPRRQRLGRRHAAIAYARCNERCTVSMSARIRIGRRSYRLRSARKLAAVANRRIKLRARLTRRSSRALRRALRRRQRTTVRVALRARDRGGNRSGLTRRSARVVR